MDFNFSAIDNIVKPALWIAIGLIMGKLVSYIFSFADCKGLVFCTFFRRNKRSDNSDGIWIFCMARECKFKTV